MGFLKCHFQSFLLIVIFIFDAHRLMPHVFRDDLSTLALVMAWCHQAVGLTLLGERNPQTQQWPKFGPLYHGLTQWPLGDVAVNIKLVIFKLISRVDISHTPSEITLRLMLKNLTNENSILVQVMSWCRQAASHYLNQCLSRFQIPCGVLRPQWFNAY